MSPRRRTASPRPAPHCSCSSIERLPVTLPWPGRSRTPLESMIVVSLTGKTSAQGLRSVRSLPGVSIQTPTQMPPGRSAIRPRRHGSAHRPVPSDLRHHQRLRCSDSGSQDASESLHSQRTTSPCGLMLAASCGLSARLTIGGPSPWLGVRPSSDRCDRRRALAHVFCCLPAAAADPLASLPPRYRRARAGPARHVRDPDTCPAADSHKGRVSPPAVCRIVFPKLASSERTVSTKS